MSKQKQETKEGVQKFLQEKLEGIGNFFGGMDDAYMGGARKHVLQLPDQGSLPEDAPLRGVREVAGRVLFPGRYGGNANPQYRYTDGDASTKGIAFANRALHAGGITAAGAGLIATARALTGGYGGPADEPARTDSSVIRQQQPHH